MRECGVLQVGVDLLDDRVMAVGLVRGDGVGIAGSAVVKNAWKRQVSNSVSCPVARCASALRSGIRRTISRPGTCSAFVLALNAVKATSATSAREIQLPAAWSKTASVYSMGVQASSAMVAMACFDRGIHGDRDRDPGAALERGVKRATAVERRVRPDQNRPGRAEQPLGGPHRVGDQPRGAA